MMPLSNNKKIPCTAKLAARWGVIIATNDFTCGTAVYMGRARLTFLLWFLIMINESIMHLIWTCPSCILSCLFMTTSVLPLSAFFFFFLRFTGLQIISQLAPVKLSGKTYFCSDISHFWPDKHRLRLIAIKVPPPPFT